MYLRLVLNTYVFKTGALAGSYSSMVLAQMDAHSQPGCPNSQWRVNPIWLQLHRVLIIIFIFACNEGFPHAPSVNYLPEPQVNRRKHIPGVDTSKVHTVTCISIFILEKFVVKMVKGGFCFSCFVLVAHFVGSFFFVGSFHSSIFHLEINKDRTLPSPCVCPACSAWVMWRWVGGIPGSLLQCGIWRHKLGGVPRKGV